MPNDYFQFKQFLIKQDKCAMKVCTDACLFGAFVAESSKLNAKCCLDIGCGTGLLSLMVYQKNNDIIIDAVEIDQAASEQAKENFKNSGWKEKLNIYNDSIQQFANSLIEKKYDVIICNPPFYENDLKSENQQRNIALHSKELSLNELVSIVQKLLSNKGNFFVLLPFHRTKYFEELLLKYELCVKEKVFIKQTSKHNYFRTIFWVDRSAATSHQSEIVIKNNENKYSDEFINLLKDYYLYL